MLNVRDPAAIVLLGYSSVAGLTRRLVVSSILTEVQRVRF